MKSGLATMFVLVTLIISACASNQAISALTPTPESTAASPPSQQEGMEHNMEKQQTGHGTELHEAAHGGQVGMAKDAAVGGGDFHIEIVSDTPGYYQVYLTDENRQPISPEGYEGTLVIIKPDGSEIASMPLEVRGDYLQAEGDPADVSQLDVRLTLKGPGLSDTLEMDFTLSY